jgi:hypothetical protein
MGTTEVDDTTYRVPVTNQQQSEMGGVNSRKKLILMKKIGQCGCVILLLFF